MTTLLKILALGAAIAAISRPALWAAERPNVLLIVVDDLNNDLGCYGHPQVKSPHVDALAARGVRFDRAYCQYPLCNPSRVSLLSGRRPDTTQVMDLQTPPRAHLGNTTFLPQYFRAIGYRVIHVGKVFHTGDALEDSASWDLEIRETGKHPLESEVLRDKSFNEPIDYKMRWAELRSADAATPDGAVARTAAALLPRLAADGAPFFLAVGFRRPHQPYAAPRPYFDLYPPDGVSLADEPPEHLRNIPTLALTYPPGRPRLPAADRRQVTAAYWACVSYVDAQVGVLTAALDKLDLWPNTIVVLASDHGYHLGEHGGLWHKDTLFEESSRVPLIVAAPGAAAGRGCDALVELVDIYPTLVDVCRLPAVQGLEGESLRPLLVDPDRTGKPAAFTQVLRDGTMGRSVRTARWRYTEWDEGRQGAELYDHDADPHERVNLSEIAAWQGVRDKLHRQLHEAATAPRTGLPTGANP